MALREIIIYPDPRLRQKAKPVAEVDASVRKLCDDVADAMFEANGAGLAAPQLGVLQNVIAVDVELRRPPQRAQTRAQPPADEEAQDAARGGTEGRGDRAVVA